jgi:hypothetical protein
MDPSKQINGLAESILMRLADQVAGIDTPMLVATLIILVVFATASRRVLIFLEATLVALVGFLVVLAPNSATIVIAIGAGLGSVLITFAGIRSRKRDAFERQKLDKLIHDVQQLQWAEESHFLRSLNSQSRQVSQGGSDTGVGEGRR